MKKYVSLIDERNTYLQFKRLEAAYTTSEKLLTLSKDMYYLEGIVENKSICLFIQRIKNQHLDFLHKYSEPNEFAYEVFKELNQAYIHMHQNNLANAFHCFVESGKLAYSLKMPLLSYFIEFEIAFLCLINGQRRSAENILKKLLKKIKILDPYIKSIFHPKLLNAFYILYAKKSLTEKIRHAFHCLNEEERTLYYITSYQNEFTNKRFHFDLAIHHAFLSANFSVFQYISQRKKDANITYSKIADADILYTVGLLNEVENKCYEQLFSMIFIARFIAKPKFLTVGEKWFLAKKCACITINCCLPKELLLSKSFILASICHHQISQPYYFTVSDDGVFIILIKESDMTVFRNLYKNILYLFKLYLLPEEKATSSYTILYDNIFSDFVDLYHTTLANCLKG